jgi:hypothetical protein
MTTSPKVYYSTVSEAIETLRKKGFTQDFNLQENCIVCLADKYGPEQFDIVEIYRYEGMTDPGDEATVYGITTDSGVKGVLVTNYGASPESMTEAMLAKMR